MCLSICNNSQNYCKNFENVVDNQLTFSDKNRKMFLKSGHFDSGVFFVQSTSNRLKDDIAECARALFRDRGYDNVSVNEICEAAHTSRSVFYSVFKGKRAILDYVVSKPQQNDEESFRKFADAENDFERIWQLFDRFIDIALDFGPKLTSRLFIMQFDSPKGIRDAVHALDDLFATLAKNCAKNGIIETEEPPELLSRIATDLILHELYVWCSQDGNFSLRERARQYAEVAYHVKPQYRMTPEQRAAL